ncbi:MAG: NFACT RNA binding domain-containing protein [Bacillota bacterium]
MPQDAINLYKLSCELAPLLVGGKINRITMPEKDEIHMQVYSKGKNHKLIISANASSPRLHLTTAVKDNPSNPPSFCMLLRKYMQNGEITSLFCDEGERIFHFTVSNKNELSDNVSFTLIVELMARQSNIFFVDTAGKILGVLKQFSLDDAKRATLAGMKYDFVSQDKLNPYSAEDVGAGIERFESGDFATFINENFMGFAFSTACELAFACFLENFKDVQLGFNKGEITEKFTAFVNSEISAVVYKNANGEVKDFSFLPYETSPLEKIEFASLNEALDYFYTTKDNAIRINEKSKSLKNVIKNAISRYEKKLKNQKKQIEDCADMEKNRIYGELITSYIYKVSYKDEFLECENYYEDMKIIKIPLQKSMSASQNAQNYYKRYAKQKRTVERVSADLSETENFITTLKNILATLSRMTDLKDLDLIREDLYALKVLAPPKVKLKAGKQSKKNFSQKTAKKEISPQRYNIKGVDVYLGKSALQNDFVSFRIAKRDDVWFHINKYFGSHVVAKVKLDEIPDDVLIICAEIAAFHSDAKTSEKAVVDYTIAGNLKKPTHGNIGLAIYHTNYSVVVTPCEHTEYMV